VKPLCLLFQFLEPTFGITVDGILGVFADVELGLERLGRSYDALLKAFETHVGVINPSDLRTRRITESNPSGGKLRWFRH
jgi:hypothetical protein